MRITNLRSWRTTSGGIHVEADVDGEPLWFVSDDAALTASPEAFASAMLIPAATRGEPLEVEAPVDRSWLEQVPAILRQAKEWWQLPGTRVIATDVIDTPRARPGTIAQCFTGGVDSFHALIHAKTPPAVLVYAHGYDFQLKHRARLDAFLPGFRETATAFGARAVLITTNLRQHSASRGTSWEKSHGGALAALGHVLSEGVERIVIPSSYPYHDPSALGIALGSGSLMVVATAGGGARGRNAPTGRKGAGDRGPNAGSTSPPRLWETQNPNRNCSGCEKCVRTMIAFAMCGRLDDCDAFDRTVPIERRVNNLAILQPHLVSIYEELLRGIDNPQLGAAVKRLIAHSRGRPMWWYKRVRRWRRTADPDRPQPWWERLF